MAVFFTKQALDTEPELIIIFNLKQSNVLLDDVQL